MKKVILIIMALSFLTFCGCGSDDSESSSSNIGDNQLPVPTVTPSASPEPPMAKIVVVNEVVGGLNVRTGASTEHEILGLAGSGDKFQLLVEDQKDGWYQIRYEGQTAFVFAEYVTVKEVTLEEAAALNEETSSSPEDELVGPDLGSEDDTSGSENDDPQAPEVERNPEDGER